ERASRRPSLFPFEQHIRTASGSDARTTPAIIEHHIASPAGPICTRSYDFQIDDRPAIRSFQRTPPVWMDRARDCAARSTNPSAQLSRVERHRHYDGIRVRINSPVSACDDAPGPCNSENNHRQRPTQFISAEL